MSTPVELNSSYLLPQFESLSAETRIGLRSYLADAQVVINHAADILHTEGMTVERARELMTQPMTIEAVMDPNRMSELDLAAQLRHLEMVLGTTLALKETLLELKVPERTFVYRKGTGLPLPRENDHLVKITELPYGGEGPLKYFPKPTVSGHTGKLAVYKVTGLGGDEATVLASMGSEHAYSNTMTPWANHRLALIPRVWKGIGAEAIIGTFATGFDSVTARGDSPYRIGDVGLMIGNYDLTGWGSQLDPGSGDQRILGDVFGGPFGQMVKMSKPDLRLAEIFVKNFGIAVTGLGTQEAEPPRLHWAYLYDCSSVPHFEAELDQAAARAITGAALDMDAVPPSLLKLSRDNPVFFTHRIAHLGTDPHHPIAIAHGMATKPEITAWAQTSSFGGLGIRYNRRLPFLALVGCTDTVDTREGGESYATTHEAIQTAERRYGQYLAPAITDLFISLADTPKA